jgi:hypothetical protein
MRALALLALVVVLFACGRAGPPVRAQRPATNAAPAADPAASPAVKAEEVNESTPSPEAEEPEDEENAP